MLVGKPMHTGHYMIEADLMRDEWVVRGLNGEILRTFHTRKEANDFVSKLVVGAEAGIIMDPRSYAKWSYAYDRNHDNMVIYRDGVEAGRCETTTDVRRFIESLQEMEREGVIAKSEQAIHMEDYQVVRNAYAGTFEVRVRGEHVFSHTSRKPALDQCEALYNRDKARAAVKVTQLPLPDEYGQW